MSWNITTGVVGSFLLIVSLLGGSTYYYKTKYENVNEQHTTLLILIKQQDELIREQNSIYKKKVERLDESYQMSLSHLNDDIKRMRQQTNISILPGDPSTNSIEEISFSRKELDRAIQQFRIGIQALVGEGSECQLDLNVAKEWGASLGSQK